MQQDAMAVLLIASLLNKHKGFERQSQQRLQPATPPSHARKWPRPLYPDLLPKPDVHIVVPWPLPYSKCSYFGVHRTGE